MTSGTGDEDRDASLVWHITVCVRIQICVYIYTYIQMTIGTETTTDEMIMLRESCSEEEMRKTETMDLFARDRTKDR